MLFPLVPNKGVGVAGPFVFPNKLLVVEAEKAVDVPPKRLFDWVVLVPGVFPKILPPEYTSNNQTTIQNMRISTINGFSSNVIIRLPIEAIG